MALCLPPGPVAVMVYVVESCGSTDFEPCSCTVPTPGLQVQISCVFRTPAQRDEFALFNCARLCGQRHSRRLRWWRRLLFLARAYEQKNGQHSDKNREASYLVLRAYSSLIHRNGSSGG